MTALHQILIVNAELASLERIRSAGFLPHAALHGILNRADKSLRNALLDILVKLAGCIALRLFEACIARKEDIGEIVIAGITDRRDVHAPQKKLRIVLPDCGCRLFKRIGRALDVVAKVACKHSNGEDDESRCQTEFSLICLASPRHAYTPRELIHRHRCASPLIKFKRCHYSIEDSFPATV